MESSNNTLIIGLVIAVIVLAALWAWSRSRKTGDVPPAKVEDKPAPKPEALVAPPPPTVTAEPLAKVQPEPVAVAAPPPPAPVVAAPKAKAPAAKKPAAPKSAPAKPAARKAAAPKTASKEAPAAAAPKPAPKKAPAKKVAPKAAPAALAPPPSPPAPPPMTAIGVPGAIGAPDSLLQIKGLGPKLNTLLTGLGITRFDQIAAWGPDEVAKVDAHLGAFKGRIERDSWIEQAGLLARGAIAEFEAKFGKLDSEN